MFSINNVDAQVQSLRQQIDETEQQLAQLKAQLASAELSQISAVQESNLQASHAGGLHPEWQREILGALSNEIFPGPQPQTSQFPLSSQEYRRYGRQLIMPQVGLRGQLRLKEARVLVVGAGGLGCPAAAYLAGAGVGTLGLIDGDVVEVSNLHRQIAHSTSKIGDYKVDSAIAYLSALNPDVKYIPYRSHLVPEDALAIFQDYDVVLDCTDHPTSRYLISDACILSGNPLVSASALRTEGQLTVLNYPPALPGATDGGPCYRCIFPKPPPADSVTSCSEGGILGPVVGLMGVLQALECLKLLTSPPPTTPPQPSLLLFSAYSTPQFRNVRLRSRRPACASCSSAATITPEALTSGSLDYVAFCGVTNPLSILPPNQRIAPQDFASTSENDNTVILDVRDPTQFELCSLPNSVNLPWNDLPQALKTRNETLDSLKGRDVVVVCKLGNDSQLAVKALQDARPDIRAWDLEGGFRAWRQDVDPTWPDY